LDEAKRNVKVQAYQMQRALDTGKVMEALKYCSNMLNEMRTSLLSPKNYYDLYMLSMDQLRQLEVWLYEQHKNKQHNVNELYEIVQYAGNILPRLYMLVTVGSVYIKVHEAPAKDILKDLVEMCRGVQHPTRGLFLRNYLSQMTKDKLPDADSEYAGEGGDVKDSIEFVLQNFTEMNKLWVRMQHQGPVKDKDKRENERLELRILVGTNLVRLSQLEGVEQATYVDAVLPRILEQIIKCKDQIAQQYLMEVLIQVFPDELHLITLDKILTTCAQLQPGVEVKAIIVSLLDRLANYATTSPELIPENIQIFEIFNAYAAKIVEQRTNMKPEDVLSLEISLLNFSLKCYPDRLDYVDKVLEFTANAMKQKDISNVETSSNHSVAKALISLLNIPLDTYKNILTVIQLDSFPKVMQILGYYTRKSVAVNIVKNILKYRTIIGEPEQAHLLFEFIMPLLKNDDSEGAKKVEEDKIDKEDFANEQNLVGRLVHLFDNQNPDKLFQIFSIAKGHFAAGGHLRIKHTLTPLTYGLIRLARNIGRVVDAEKAPKGIRNVFQFTQEVVIPLKKEFPDFTLRLLLQCAQAASNCKVEAKAYDFLAMAFEIYEEEISESKDKFNAITLIIGTLQTLRLSDENYDTMTTQTAGHASKLLKKPNQCTAVYLCSHLFWTNGGVRDAKRVLECLQKSLKIAYTCIDSSIKHVNLFVEVLNEYLYYFEYKNEAVTVKYLNDLIKLIETNMENLPNNEETGEIFKHYQNTLEYIRYKQSESHSNGPNYNDIELKTKS